MKRCFALGLAVLLMSIAAPALARNIAKTQTAGPYKVELQVLPPEPFHSAKEVAAGKAKSGMLVLGGAEPVQPGAPSHPNHHLIVHVFQKSTGKAVTDANVEIAYQRLNNKGQVVGKEHDVRVVRMKVVGKGAATTHYGNNVSLAAGQYRVHVVVNGHPAYFVIRE